MVYLLLLLSTPTDSVTRFDPQLKAGSSFYATLPIPSDLIEDALTVVRQEGEANPSPSVHTRKAYEYGGQHSLDNARSFAGAGVEPRRRRRSVTWIIEVMSQIIFSATASVGFELMLGRDEKSLNSGILRPGTADSSDSATGEGATFSRALKVKTQTTQDLWNIPPFPSWHNEDAERWRLQDGEYLDPEDQDEAGEKQQKKKAKKRKPKRIHLVILTHGLHSNTGTDMLFMKEAIDEEARKGDIAWRERRRKERAADGKKPDTNQEEGEEEEEEEDNREQVIVRGFHDNVCRTELGIKYLGRRLAKYILHLVHPDTSPSPPPGPNRLHKPRPAHRHPHLATLEFLHDHEDDEDVPPYKITSISFVGHSLGGLVQTYAIAYIHAHSPNFFTDITPINFVALATPFLGLSNENPLYVKFALDFGLVGRTGQDLGLTWRAPSAFSAFTSKTTAVTQPTDTSKPLLRILPTGPAHEVLRRFRNRTAYANVVNDGIVPLRTSCLLFLDWKGLGKVEKARRENGAVQGLVGWGWGQLTNGGSTSPRGSIYSPSVAKNTTIVESSTSPVTPGFWSRGKIVETPVGGRSPLIQASDEDNPITEAPLTDEPTIRERQASGSSLSTEAAPAKVNPAPSAFTSLLTLFRPNASSKPKPLGDYKSSKIYRRSQTMPLDDSTTSSPKPPPAFPQPADLDSLPPAPPRTTLLEAANHILNPPLPSVKFIIDPSSRPRTIFHDRVYSSTDVPPPSPPSDTNGKDSATKESMKVEEKIARAYHCDLAWRKVLVRLEPDAHNNMIVRRMFANAYGWPVARHVVETHFGENMAALTADTEEGKEDRAESPDDAGDGDVTPRPGRVVPELDLDIEREIKSRARSLTASSGTWTDRAFAVTDDEDSDSSEDVEARKEEDIGRFLGLQPRLQRPDMGGEMRHKSSSTTAGARVDIVVSPGSSGSGSASGDMGDGPGAVWGGEGGSGLGLGDVTKLGLGRWGNTAGRPTGASLEPVKGGGSDAVRLLERNISIAGPLRTRDGSANSREKAGSRSGRGSGNGSGSGSGSGNGSRRDSGEGSDIGERDKVGLSPRTMN